MSSLTHTSVSFTLWLMEEMGVDVRPSTLGVGQGLFAQTTLKRKEIIGPFLGGYNAQDKKDFGATAVRGSPVLVDLIGRFFCSGYGCGSS